MRTEEEIRNEYERFLKHNPREWVLKSRNPSLQGWYDGYQQAMEFVLTEVAK